MQGLCSTHGVDKCEAQVCQLQARDSTALSWPYRL